jgi:hypothetical protein
MTRTTSNDSLFGTDPSGAANILDNAGFEIWQRGAVFSSVASAAYTADRYNISYLGTPTVNISRESSIVDSGLFSFKCAWTSGSTRLRIDQSIENDAFYSGKTVSISIRVWSNVVGLQIFVIYVGGTTVSSSFHPGDSAWHTLTMTLTIPAAGITVAFGWDTGAGGGFAMPTAGTFYLDSAMMTIGLQPASAFIPLHPQQDLARCQRYFYATPGLINMYVCQGQAQSTTTATYVFKFFVPMRAAPTLTVNNVTNFSTWAAGGSEIVLTALVFAGGATSTDSFLLQASVASGLVAGNITSLNTTNSNAQLFFSADI